MSHDKVPHCGPCLLLSLAALLLGIGGCDLPSPDRTGKGTAGGPVPPWTGREDEFEPEFLRYVRAHPEGTRQSPADVLFPIKDNKYGYMDRAGNLVVPPVFGLVMPRDPEWDDCTGDPQRLHPVQAGKWDCRRRTYFDHWGYVDNCGKVRILPRFDFALPFEGGYAPVQVGAEEWERFAERLGNTERSVAGGKWGIIDETGEFVVPPRYSHCTSFGEDGLAAVGAAGGKWGYVNRKGRMVISPRFNFAGPFWEGLAVVNIGKKPDEDISHGSWVASGKWGVIDTTGREVIPIDREAIEWEGFRNGMVRAHDRGPDGLRMGLMDTKGRWVVAAKFHDIRHFDDGVAQVRVGQYWGLVNRQGEFVLRPEYRDMLPFSEGLAAVAVETTKGPYHGWKWGFIDHNGSLRISVRFSGAESFSEGLAAVAVGEYQEAWGYVDRQGEWWIRPQFMGADPFLRGLAEVKLQDGRYRYINKEGEVVTDAYSPG